MTRDERDSGEITQVVIAQAIIPEAVVVTINQGQDARKNHSYLADACQCVGSGCTSVGNVCYNECNFIGTSCVAVRKRCGLALTSCGESIGDTCSNSCQCIRNRLILRDNGLRVSTATLPVDTHCAFMTGVCIGSCIVCLLD